MLRTALGIAVTAIVTLAGTTVATQAQDLRYSAAFHECQEEAVSTVDMLVCYDAEIALSDARLNKAYQALVQQFTKDDKELPLEGATAATSRVGLLRAAERAWIAYRDADCKSWGSIEGAGSLGAVVAAGCYLDHLITRTLALERMKDD